MLHMVELTLRGSDPAQLSANLRVTSAAATLAADVPVALDHTALLERDGNPAAYGKELSRQLFADQRLREAWLKARARAAGDTLQLRLHLPASAKDLHALRWETLCDPETARPLALDERVRLVRTLDTADLTPFRPAPRPELRALVVVSNPSDLSDFKLAEVDVDGEVARIRAALGDIPCTILGEHADAECRATTTNITAQLRSAPPLVFVVAHGTQREDGAYIWLEQDDGTSDQVAGAAFVQAVERLTTRPLCMALLSCQSAGRGYGDMLSALGPQLVGIGIPAVLAFQGNVAMSTVKALLPTLISELIRDGQLDRALAAARAALGEKKPWWQAVAWLRTDGRVWAGEDERSIARRQRLRAALSQRSKDRLGELRQGFVGRHEELDSIQAETETLRGCGGYLLVTGVAGQGKSCILAALVAQCGEENTPAYFIRFSPGADEQNALLRHLVASLLIQHGLEELTDEYLSDTAILANSLTMALKHISDAGKPVTLIIDGLDQIRPDRQMGERDLSFLPESLPTGVVIIIGTRPDDTLKPLPGQVAQREYRLPPLRQEDFAALLAARDIALATHDRQALYAALHGNAFDLAFVVNELGATPHADIPALLERVKQNPQDIFTPAFDRLKADKDLWNKTILPILGCLLAAVGSEPMSEDALIAILDRPTNEVSEALLRLRGFLGETDRNGRAYYYLYHLKLIAYLQGTPTGALTRIFSPRDLIGYHQRLATWCASDLDSIWRDAPGDALEQERRTYARQHYIAHLAAARSYAQLWDVIDSGLYGQAKRRHDPSMRSYVLDLDIARQAVIDAALGDADAQARALPRLWKYSLLRCSLTSQVDNYPEELFLALVALGREREAINLAELLSDVKWKANTLRAIGITLLEHGSDEGLSVLKRARAVAQEIQVNDKRAEVLFALVKSFAKAQCWDEARTTVELIIDTGKRSEALICLAKSLAAAQHPEAEVTFAIARDSTAAINDDWQQANAFIALAQALASVQYPEVETMFAAARVATNAIQDYSLRIFAFRSLSEALADTQQWDRARATADAIPDAVEQTQALFHLAKVLANAQQWDKARATADAISDTSYRASALRTLVETLATAHHWDQARTTADAISDTLERVYALSALAQARAVAQPEKSALTFRDARASVDAIAGEYERVDSLITLAQALAASHHPLTVKAFTDARATADTISDTDLRGSALRNLVKALATAQHWDEAWATANAISDIRRRTEAFLALAEALVVARHSLATAALSAIRVLTDAIPNAKEHTKALTILAQSLAASHHPLTVQAFTDARATADTILDVTERASALHNLVIAHVVAQDWDAARATADDIPYAAWNRTNHRVLAFRYITRALTDAQHWDAARATADAISDAKERDRALHDLVEALAGARQWDKARATVDAILDATERDHALHTLVKALATAQDWDAARATADAISDIRIHTSACVTLVKSLAMAGYHDKARATIDTIATHNLDRTQALIALTFAFAAIQDWEKARASADTIPGIPVGRLRLGRSSEESRASTDAILNYASRDYALNALAQAFATAHRFDEARTTINAITDSERRAIALSDLAQILATVEPERAASTCRDARTTADAIPDVKERASVLRSLTEVLAQTQCWKEARATADAITDADERDLAYSTLAETLTQAQRWDEACMTTEAIADPIKRISALHALVQIGSLEQTTSLLADLWLQTQTRKELLDCFAIDAALFRAHPELGQEFLDNFAWVDAQLRLG